MQKIEHTKLTYSVPEAAEVLGISSSKMYELARSASFPSFTVGKRILISREGLERWVATQGMPS